MNYNSLAAILVAAVMVGGWYFVFEANARNMDEAQCDNYRRYDELFGQPDYESKALQRADNASLCR